MLERISAPSFLKQVRENGEYMVEKAKKLPGKIRQIRHAGGLFAGVEFEVPVKKLISDAQNEGKPTRKEAIILFFSLCTLPSLFLLFLGILFVNAGENVLRLCPTLIAQKTHIDHAMKVLAQLIPKMEDK